MAVEYQVQPGQEKMDTRQDDANAPPGWTYNPSAWSQRLPILVLALFNCCLAGYLAVCQIWFHGNAWDPFFGEGTHRVLTSSVSRAFPVSDAALGATAYLLEAICCALGDARRWQTKPWLVLSFGLLVLPLSVVSVTLIILQPVVVHAWCSLCLLQATGMLLMVPLALDEVLAVLQFLERAFKRNSAVGTLWKVFWHGETPEEAQNDVPVNSAPRTPSHAATPFTGYTPS